MTSESFTASSTTYPTSVRSSAQMRVFVQSTMRFKRNLSQFYIPFRRRQSDDSHWRPQEAEFEILFRRMACANIPVFCVAQVQSVSLQPRSVRLVYCQQLFSKRYNKALSLIKPHVNQISHIRGDEKSYDCSGISNVNNGDPHKLDDLLRSPLGGSDASSLPTDSVRLVYMRSLTRVCQDASSVRESLAHVRRSIPRYR